MPKPFRSSRLVAALGIAWLAIVRLPSPPQAQAQGCDIPSFNTRPFRPTENVKDVPSALAAGTFFKHDGETRCGCDLAVTVAGEKDLLVILRGDDSGAFVHAREQPAIGIGSNPVGLVSGRFIQSRADDLDDLVVLSGTGSERARVALFAPDTNGRYQQVGADVLVAPGPKAIVAGKFNADENLDVSILSDTLASQSLTVLFGDGKGGFAAESPAVLAITDPSVWSIAAGSFQGNTGPDDIAVAHTDATGNVRVSIARRSAAAGFQFLGPVVVGAGGEAHLAAGTLGRRAPRSEDLVIAFADVKGGGHAALLRGGAQVARTATIDGIPRSIHLDDSNGDGNDDLAVAVFASADAANPDGSITIFRGAAGTLIDFDSPLWKTPPSPILPRRLLSGRFGRDRATGVRHLGLAAVNAPALNTVSVYVGNGTGAFAAPSGFATAIDANATLLVQGDFDTSVSSDKVLDLAYLLPEPGGEHVLMVLLGNGERTFRRLPGSVRVGRGPLQMIAGRFDKDQLIDIAVVDANPGDSQRRPRLRIWVGDGRGSFRRPTGVADFLLDAGETPVAIATGQFRNVSAARPSDVAIVSSTPAGTGTLKLFLNDGTGQFEVKPTPLAFKPGPVAASDKFRGGGVYDVVIKRQGSGRFAFLENRGDGEFSRIEEFDDPAGDADAAGHFLVGDVNADGLDDVVQVDADRSIDVFRNTGTGSFAFGNVEALKSLSPAFDPAGATFFLEKFVTGPPALLGVVKPSGGQAAIVAARGDGSGGFVNPRLDVLDLPRAESLEFAASPPRTRFDVNDISHAERTGIEALAAAAFAGRFANELHGNDHDDIGFLSRVGRITVAAGACPSDPRPNPGPIETCTPSDDDALCQTPCPSPACTAAKASCVKPACQNPPCARSTCMIRCPDDCVQTPRRAFCETGAQGLYLVVFRNTCGG
jgi:hypothetical protein